MIFERCDILVCQELMILPDEAFILSGLSDEFDYVLTSSIPSDSNLGEGRPSGGMASFYRSTLNIFHRSVHESLNLSLFELFVDNLACFHLVSMYMPCDMRPAKSQVHY